MYTEKNDIRAELRPVLGIVHGALIPALIALVAQNILRLEVEAIPLDMIIPLGYLCFGFYIYNVEHINPPARSYFNVSGSIMLVILLASIGAWADLVM